MKRIIVLFFLFAIGKLHAQFNESSPATIKFGSGYTHDFPGLNGYTVAGEYTFSLIKQIQGGIGVKHADMSGYPRTATVHEYTKANTLDFNLYWVPFQSETQLARIGLGYSFSFYDVKRAYPLTTTSSDGKSSITWPSTITKGRTTGINLIAEYEFKIPNSPITIGLRGALYKAYNRTYFIGPMIGYQL
jgi:hypothetical protein